MSKLDVIKKTILKTQSHEQNYKNSVRNSQLFQRKRRSTTMDAFTRLVDNINLDCRSLGGIKRVILPSPNVRIGIK